MVKYDTPEKKEQLLKAIIELNKSWSPEEVLDFYDTILCL